MSRSPKPQKDLPHVVPAGGTGVIVGNIVVTAIAFDVASANDGVDMPGSFLWGALMFLPSCVVTVPIVGRGGLPTVRRRPTAASRRDHT